MAHSPTDETFRKSLEADAAALWDLYIDTMPLDMALANLIKARADAALDRWHEFSMLSLRHENELTKTKLMGVTQTAVARVKAYY